MKCQKHVAFSVSTSVGRRLSSLPGSTCLLRSAPSSGLQTLSTPLAAGVWLQGRSQGGCGSPNQLRAFDVAALKLHQACDHVPACMCWARSAFLPTTGVREFGL